MDTQTVVDYLKPILLGAGFVSVQNALSLNALPNWDQVPAVFVYPVRDQALGDNTLGTYAHSQMIREGFAIVHVCALDDLEARRGSVHGALLPTLLPGYVFQTQFETGEILEINRTLVWWRDVYAVQRERRYT